MIAANKLHVRSYGMSLAFVFGILGFVMTVVGVAGVTVLDVQSKTLSGHLQTTLAGIAVIFLSTAIAIATISKRRCNAGSIEIRTPRGTVIKLGGVEHQRELLGAMPALVLVCEAQAGGMQTSADVMEDKLQSTTNKPAFELVSIRESA